MTDENPHHRMPDRPGLPVDPILQLYAGLVLPPRTVTWTGGSADPVADANPARVALFCQTTSGVGDYSLAPFPGPVSSTIAGLLSPAPTAIHCRDYPGICQGAWVGAGTIGASITVWEYVLQGFWG